MTSLYLGSSLVGSNPPKTSEGFIWKGDLSQEFPVVNMSELGLYQPGRVTNLWLPALTGHEFMGYAVRGGHTLTAHVLDHLDEDPSCYPEEWKTDVHGLHRRVFFFGSVFRRISDGVDCVAFLSWDGGLHKGHELLSREFFERAFAATAHPDF